MAGSKALILTTFDFIRRICRSFDAPKTRTRPSETVSVIAEKASVVLSQRSLSSSIGVPSAPAGSGRLDL